MSARSVLAARRRIARPIPQGARKRLRGLIEPDEPRSEGPQPPEPPGPALPPDPVVEDAVTNPRGKVLRLELGIQPDGTPLIWDSTEQANSFVLAMGASGFGKTEILKLFAEAARKASLPVILADVHDDLHAPRMQEYRMGPGGYSLNPLDTPGSLPERTAWITAPIEEAGGMGHRQSFALTKAVGQALQEAQDTHRRPTIASLKEIVGRSLGSAGSIAEGLLSKLDKLFTPSAFDGREVPIANLLTLGGRLQMVALSPPAQLFVMHTLLAQLWGAVVRQGAVPAGRLRALLVIDEAARLKGSALLDRVVREARKFGLGVCIASQLPTDTSEAVRANAGTAIVLGLQGNRSQDQAAELLGSVSRSQIAELRRPGDAWVRSAAGVHRLQLRRPGGP